MSDEQQSERTFEATDLRREQFRKQGRFARSRDAAAVAATGATIAALAGSHEGLHRGALTLFQNTIGNLSALQHTSVFGVLSAAAGPIVSAALPALIAAGLAGFLVGFAQGGFRPNTDALGIKLERFDPIGGLKRIFSWKEGSMEGALAVLRVTLVGYVAYRALLLELPVLMSLGRMPLSEGFTVGRTSMFRVLGTSLAALFVVSAADYAYSWFKIERDVKMTRKERTDEARQQEGDPKAKGRMRARSRALAKKRALGNVKSADVIVTNPTHIAVALRYGPRDAAPVVLVKGHDEIALEIRREARKYGIPILENRPLARALDAEVPVGRPIPQAHFAAVAQVLAFVYRLRKRGAFGTPRA